MYPEYYKSILVIYQDGADGACASWTVPTSDKIRYISSCENALFFEDLEESVVFIFGSCHQEKTVLERALFTFIFLSSENKEEFKTEKSFCIFDPERSVCQISWDFFHPHEERPWFVDCIGLREAKKVSTELTDTLYNLYSLENMDTYNFLITKQPYNLGYRSP